MKLFVICMAAGAAAFGGAQVVPGQTDTFPTDLMNWGGATPSWVSTGGPAGAGDSFLQLHSTGAATGPNSHMAAKNNFQWSGDFSGISAITVDFNNLGQNELDMRLVFFDAGLATQWVSNAVFALGPTPGWQHVTFNVSQSLFTQVEGTTNWSGTITAAQQMMFRHDPGGPSADGTSVLATLGVDNVHAVPAPEPATLAALGLGVLALRRRRRT